MNGFDFVIMIILLSMIKGTVHKYMELRMRMADRQVGSGDRNLLRVVEEVRAEMAALKQHETDTILSFDSTLQTLDARLKNVERRVLADGAADRPPLSAAGRPPEESARIEMRGGSP